MELPRPPFQPIVKDDEVYVPFTQYRLPHGTPVEVGVTMPISFKPKVDAITNAGGKFEVEILTTGHVSMTVSIENLSDEDPTIAHELSANGPEIDAALVRLVDRAYELITAF